MAGMHVLLYLSHFLSTILISNIFYSILPIHVTNYFFQLANSLLCVCITKLTFGISKKIFLNEWLKPERKAVLITGCARGIGKALAKHLDSKGFHVFASCRDSNTQGADDLRKCGSSRLQVFQLDVTSDESVKRGVQFVKDNLGECELWAVINNAGIQKGFLTELSSLQDFQDTLEVNAVGPVRVTRAFLPLLRKSRGRVINIASVAGRFTIPYVAPYTMSKFACVGFSECLRYELDLWGMKVISIEPEYFESDMSTKTGIEKRVGAMLANTDENVREEYGEEFLKAFKSIAGSMFPPSQTMQKVTEAVECAVGLKHPDAVYRVCRNFALGIGFSFLEVLPTELKVVIVRIGSCLAGFPIPGQVKKSM